jgi:YNFM family putative membrane transporter
MNVSFWERKLKNSENVLKTMSLVGILGILFFFLQNTIAVIVGLAVFTYSFFVAHTVCSKSVGNFSKEKRTVTIAFYLLLYYIGASTLGSFSGVILQKLDWQIFLGFSHHYFRNYLFDFCLKKKNRTLKKIRFLNFIIYFLKRKGLIKTCSLF